LDVDKSGLLDKEEFMGWVFQTHNHYSGGVRSRLQNLTCEKATELFYRIDDNKSGEINKSEFQHFLQLFAFEGGLTREEGNLLFKSIDTDRSGLIDLDEFLDWVFPERKVERARRLNQLRGNPWAQRRMRAGHGVDPDAELGGKQTKVFEMEPGKPVVVTFTIGKKFEPTFLSIRGGVCRTFGADKVELRYVIDPSISSCSRVVANIGRGMILWDKNSMVPYRQNPFLDQVSALQWMTQLLADNLPDMLEIAEAEERNQEARKQRKGKDEKKK